MLASRSPMIASLLFAGMVLTSCTQHYTGSLGLGFGEKEQVRDYQQQRQQNEAVLAQGHTGGSTGGQAAFEHPAASVGEQRDLREVSGPSPTGTTRSGGPLNLFGQVSPTQPGGTSANDAASNLRQVSFTNEGSDFDPIIDPTGRWLIFASTRHRATSGLYRMRIGGTAVTRLTDDPANEVMPAISPDGKYIAFASDRTGTWDIYLMDVEGGRAVQLTNEPTHNLHPSFSPDGKQLVYCSFGSQSGQWEMIVIDLEKPGQKKFIGYGLFPQWSPVDNRIVYQQARQRGTRWFSIWTVEMVNGEAMSPTELAASSNAACITPVWSPDGQHIVFCTVIDPSADVNSRPSHADIWMMNADGSNRVRMTGGRFANLQPTWSPDGAIYFVSNRAAGGVETIWSLSPQRAMQLADPRRGSEAQPPQASVPVEP